VSNGRASAQTTRGETNATLFRQACRLTLHSAVQVAASGPV